tara:strand:- start:145 stop:324 length:180 start_codon:yes stop_codon:yes gene_type:complete
MFCFFVLNLNTNIIAVDLIFFELEIGTGPVLLISFLIGCLLTLILEFFYFFRKKPNKSE